MRVAFRADASLHIGTGHVMRCLALADALRERGAGCSFVCRPHQGHLLALIAQRGHQILALPELKEGGGSNHSSKAHVYWLGTDWAIDAQDTQQALNVHTGGQPVDWLVVDHYALDARWEELLRPQAKRIMVIDDLADRSHACDLLLDQNLGRQEADYDGLLRGKSTALIGPQYALLRPEFAALRAQSLARRQNNPQLRRLLITMGGVDKDNATSQVLAQNQVAIARALSQAGAALMLQGKAIAQTLPNLVSTVASAEKLYAVSQAASGVTEGKGVLFVSDLMNVNDENHALVQ